MNTRTELPLMALAVAVTAVALPPTLAQAACVTYLAASAPVASDDCAQAYGCGPSQAGGLPSIAMGLNRVKAQAISEGGTSVFALSAPPQSSANIACLSDEYGAPIVMQGLAHARDHLHQVLNRLAQSREPGRSQAAGWSMYALGGAQSSRQDAGATTAAASALRVHRVDLTVGGDYRLNNEWVGGASLGVGNPRMRWSGNPVRVDGTSTNLTAYGSWSPSAASYVSAAISTERTRYTLSSDDGVTSTRDHARASHVGLSLSAGHDFTSGSWTVSPYARADQISSRLGSFSNLSSENKGRTGSVSAGSQLQFNIPTQWGLIVPHARLEFTSITRWKLSGDSSATYAASAGVLPSPSPLQLDRQFGLFGIGASALFQRGTTVFTDYDTGFAQKGVSSWRFTLGLRTEL